MADKASIPAGEGPPRATEHEVEWLTEEYVNVPDEEPCALLQEMWDKGLIYLANLTALHQHGYAIGVQTDKTGREVIGLNLHRTGDPEGIWFGEDLTHYGRQKLLEAGLIDGAHRGGRPSSTHRIAHVPLIGAAEALNRIGEIIDRHAAGGVVEGTSAGEIHKIVTEWRSHT